MYRIAVIDDDENWGLAIQRFFRKDFVVNVFTKVSAFLQVEESYDVVIVDFSIPPASYEKDMDGSQLINYLKQTKPFPPILILSTGFISKNDSQIAREICPAADAFIAKDAGLDSILEQVKTLIKSKTVV